MPKRIPVQAVKRFAEQYQCRQVILVAWDGERTHVVTYGDNVEECDQAAEGGNRVKEALGWPESLRAEPSRVKNLKARIEELEAALKSSEGSLAMLRLGIDEANRMAQERRIAASQGSDPGDDPDYVGY